MRRALAWISPAVAFCLGCQPESAPASLRIATWNVHNLFDSTQDGDEEVTPRPLYETRLDRVGRVLAELDADVVVLEEVESARVLADLAARAPHLGYAELFMFPGNDPRGINIGALARVAIDSAASHRADKFGAYGYHYARDCLELRLTRGASEVVLLAVHFKSKAPPDDPKKRLAEAEHTRGIADGISAGNPGAGILVLGDFNDTPSSAALLAIAGGDPDPYTDVTEVMAAPFTYEHAGEEELIDHAMANRTLLQWLDLVSVAIPHSPEVRAASDHAPLVATFELP
jgi:endonuclease/exonuclease/phosphatase family metal-dependent hydrolase